MINIYDFDYTIYRGDSTVDFYFFSIKKRPALLRFLPQQLLHAVRYKLRAESKTEFKSGFLAFLRDIDDVDSYVQLFWQQNSSKLKPWYLSRDHSNDVIVSASPDFLLRPLENKLGVKHVIATKVDVRTGNISGNNCYGIEKVRRITEEVPGVEINEAYSDHPSDEPILRLARHPYIVTGDNIRVFKS
jgi:HAD superfamily phosphoserine phosphatase-like hydrolase